LEEVDSDPGLVALRDIPFACISVDTLLPFHGNCHVVYKIANRKILGLSKVARIVSSASKRIQSQQQLTDMVAGVIAKVTGSSEVAVVVEATHVYYDRPLASIQTSKLSGKFANGRQDTQDLKLLLQIDDIQSSSLQAQACRRGLPSDPLTEERLRHSLASLFNRIRITLPNQEAIHEYSRQMYWATAGHREPLAAPVQSDHLVEGDKDDRQSVRPAVVSSVFDFVSTCEHHLLPFHGQVFVGCCCRDPVAARSCMTLSIRPAVASIASRLQVQEQLTSQVADYAMNALNAESVLVICEAVHLCMIARGPVTHQTVTRTTCRRGDVSNELTNKGIAALRRTH